MWPISLLFFFLWLVGIRLSVVFGRLFAVKVNINYGNDGNVTPGEYVDTGEAAEDVGTLNRT